MVKKKLFQSSEQKQELVPVRPKFERIESDAQKKMREQSAFHKQKLIDQDPWIPMDIFEKSVILES